MTRAAEPLCGLDAARAVHLLCIAKQPSPGRVKTRLTSAYTAEEAAMLAGAALRDTLATLAAVPAAARTVAFDGDPTGWVRDEFAVVPQRGDGLDERLAAAFDDCWARHPAPILLVGMDTPQLNVGLLCSAAATLMSGECDAVLGPAADGGWWALGLRRPDPGLLVGVPMSRGDTCVHQRARLAEAGLRVEELPTLRDVDLPADVALVASATAEGSAFARLAAELGSRS